MNPLSLFILAFSLEMIDNAMGGGYGTILSPLLLLIGYDPRVIVPAILISEMVSGLWGGAWHFRFNHVDLRTIVFTVLGSLLGMGGAAFLIGTVFPASVTKLFIGLIALLMGVFIVFRSLRPKKNETQFTSAGWKYSLLGVVAGFNKGGSGGGYGPLSVAGYINLGLSAATAIGTTTVAEGIACTIGVLFYSQITGFVLTLAVPITLGAFLADPIAAWLNDSLGKKLNPLHHGRVVGVVMCLLGLLSILKLLL